jgi:predicted phage terminase large subunit-like protein
MKKSLAADRLRQTSSEDILMMAGILGFDVAPVHKRMAAAAGRERSLLLAPRGFGKSTLLTVVRCIFEIIRNPDIRILLASNTQAQAEAFAGEIRSHIERSPMFRKLYGDLAGKKWTSREMTVGRRRKIAKEPTIFAVGVGGALVSRHFDLIICDDIVDEENSRTETQREKLRTWFYKVMLPCLEPDGRIGIVGTRYHYRDLYGHLIETGFAEASIAETGGAEIDPADSAKTLPGEPVTIIRAIDAEGKSPWPEKFSVGRLERIRREAGTVIFNAQYQNDTSAMKGAVFKDRWLRYYDAIPKKLRIFQGVDLSIAQHSRADYFAIVTIGVDEPGNIYVLDCYQARLSFRQQTAAIVERFRRYDPIKVAIESNAYQAAQVECVRELGVIRATKVFTKTDKLTRAWKLSAQFEDGRVFLGRNMPELVEQLLTFPQCEHDDLFDALELAISLSAAHGPKMRFF